MFDTFSKHVRLMLVWGLFIGVLSLGVSLFFPKQYSAESEVLIISRDRSGVDPYTQAKSAERIGENLAQVMNTSDFYQKVLASNVNFNKDRWQKLSERDQRKQWPKDVQPAMVYNTSLLKITVFAATQEETTAFAKAVTETVVSQGTDYIGGDVALKEVSSPLVSRFPARPNLIVNGVIGFVAGVFIAALWTVRYKKHKVFGSL